VVVVVEEEEEGLNENRGIAILESISNVILLTVSSDLLPSRKKREYC
jgi:hypothetical protein